MQDSFMSLSNFYLSKKGADKKLLKVKVTGFDLANKPVLLGKL
jgi:hypothetical protein